MANGQLTHPASPPDAADGTQWESADLQLARIRQFVVWDIAAAIAGLALLATFWIVWRPMWAYPTLAAVLFSLGVLLYSLRLIEQRRLSAAVFAVATSFWFIIPAITFVLPVSFAACSLASIWPVLLATPYVDRPTLRRLAYVTFPVAILSLALSLRGDPFGVEDTLGTTVMNISLIGIGIAFVSLTLLMIWAYNNRLQDTLTGLQETNAMIAANERQLEVKVAARTDELESASAYLRAVIDNLPQGLLTLDSGGYLLERNSAFVEQFDLHATEVSLDELPADLQQVVRALDDPGEALDRSDDRSRFIAMKGDRIGKAKATPITVQTSAGFPETIGAVVLIDDVTAERQVDRMKTDFISTVSHELRTPLTSVLGFARIIQKRLDDRVFPHVDTDAKGTERAMGQVSDNLTIILEEGGRLTNLINDVLDISKMEARQVDWKFAPTSLHDVVATAVSATASLFEDGPVEVRVDMPRLPLVAGEHERLVQVLINLLSNAQKFTDAGSVTIAARAETTTSGEPQVLLSVTDTGVGVAEADLPLLFERFRQVGDSLTDRPTGTGLGLPICREIVEAHDGTIEARSQLGVGTTFEVRLPATDELGPEPIVATSPAPSLTEAMPGAAGVATVIEFATEPLPPVRPQRSAAPASAPSVSAPPAASPAPSGEHPHVLVVDDDAGVRSLLRQLFESEGYRVSQAESGDDAVAIANHDRPDLVTLDVLMPGLSGNDTASALRASAATANVPLMFVSVLDTVPGPASEVDAHVTKPIDAERLLSIARELVEGQMADDEAVVVSFEPAAESPSPTPPIPPQPKKGSTS